MREEDTRSTRAMRHEQEISVMEGNTANGDEKMPTHSQVHVDVLEVQKDGEKDA